MTQDKRGMLAQIFIALMIFSVLVGAWSVAFMIAWPKEKTDVWKPEFRLVAICADNEPCGVFYQDLADAKAAGTVKTLTPAAPNGERPSRPRASSGSTRNASTASLAGTTSRPSAARSRS